MLPRVIIHNAVSLDGRTDRFTPDIGLFYELITLWKEDATLAGSETILKAGDDALAETEKDFQMRKVKRGDFRPLLVIADSRGRIRNWHYWLQQPYWRDAIALCSEQTPRDYLDYLSQRHIDYIIAGDGNIDMRKALEEIHVRYKVKVVRVDSGGVLNGVLLREGLVDEVSVLVHPGLVGGVTPSSFFRAPDLMSTEGVINLKLIDVQRLKHDNIWMRYEVIKPVA